MTITASIPAMSAARPQPDKLGAADGLVSFVFTAYYYLGQYERAIEDCDEAIRLDPLFAHAYQMRGVANQALGNNSAADRDFKEASELSYTP